MQLQAIPPEKSVSFWTVRLPFSELAPLRRSRHCTSSVSYNSGFFDKYGAVANESEQAILSYDIACEARILKPTNLRVFIGLFYMCVFIGLFL